MGMEDARRLPPPSRMPDHGLTEVQMEGKDVADIISIAIYTGLRISDVALSVPTACRRHFGLPSVPPALAHLKRTPCNLRAVLPK